jgi:hypothetical protein
MRDRVSTAARGPSAAFAEPESAEMSACCADAAVFRIGPRPGLQSASLSIR